MAAELWQAGRSLRVRPKSVEELRDRIESHPCNEVRIIRSRAVIQALEISPTSALWAPTGDAPAPTRKGESARLSHASRKMMVLWNAIERYPTLLETVVELDEHPEVSALCRLLRDSVPADLREEPLTGAADLGDQGVFLSILNRLAPWAKAIPELADCFDDLHPILIGPVLRCRGLADALGTGEIYSCGEGPSALAFLGLEENVARSPEAKEKARPWLVRRDATTRPRELGSMEGELRFGGHLFLTARRREEMHRQGLLAAPPAGWIEWPVVQAKYLELLDISPGEMLTGLSSADLIEQTYEEIDRVYQELSGVEPLIRRIWMAHRIVYETKGHRLFGRTFQDLLKWLEERYFSPQG